MGNRVVFWMRRHSVARVNRPGDWFGMGYPVPVVTPFGDEAKGDLHTNGLRVELERARGEPEKRRPGRPVGSKAKR